MSPEQAKGRPTDRRSDIWAYRVCVVRDAHRAVAFGAPTPSGRDSRRCLSRTRSGRRLPGDAREYPEVAPTLAAEGPKRRLHDIADARIEIEEAQRHLRASQRESASDAGSGSYCLSRLGARHAHCCWVGVLAFASPAPAAEMRLEIATPPTTDPVSLAISPDGKRLSSWPPPKDGRGCGCVRSVPIRHGRWKGPTRPGFRSGPPTAAGGVLRGWEAQADRHRRRIARNPGGRAFGYGGAWSRDARGPLCPVAGNPDSSVSRRGWRARQRDPRGAAATDGPRLPQFLPDGTHFLFYVLGSPEARGVYIGELGSSETRRLLPIGRGRCVRAVGAPALRSPGDAVCAGLRSGSTPAERQSVSCRRTGRIRYRRSDRRCPCLMPAPSSIALVRRVWRSSSYGSIGPARRLGP